MAEQLSKETMLNERTLSKHVGGQSLFGDPFSNGLLDLLGENALDDDLRFGAVIADAPLDDLFTYQTEDGQAISTSPTVTFDDGKPTVRSVVEDPTDGSTREMVARLDESGRILETEETRTQTDGSSRSEAKTYHPGGKLASTREILTAADGSQTLTETLYHEGGIRTLETQKDAEGNVVSSQMRDQLQSAALGSGQLEATVTYHDDGTASVRLTRKDEDDTIVLTHEGETKPAPGNADYRVQEARFKADELSDYVVTIYFDASPQGNAPLLNSFRHIELSHVHRDPDNAVYAESTTTYYQDGTTEIRTVDAPDAFTSTTTIKTYHPDGSFGLDIQKDLADGEYQRTYTLTDATGRLLRETHGSKESRNSDVIEVDTVYHEDGTVHVTETHRSSNWVTLLLKRETTTFPDGIETIQTETFPDYGHRVDFVRRTVEEQFVFEKGYTHEKVDGTTEVFSKTYYPEGGFESSLEIKNADGEVTYTKETRETRTPEGGTHTRIFEDFQEDGTRETITVLDAEDHLVKQTVIGVGSTGDASQIIETWTYGVSEFPEYRKTFKQFDREGKVTHHNEQFSATDDEGNSHFESVDYHSDGSTSRSFEHRRPDGTYYQTGNVITELLEDGRSKVTSTTYEGNYAGPKTVVEAIVDEDGNVLSSTTTETRDGRTSTHTAYPPDEDGTRREVMVVEEGPKTTTATKLIHPDGRETLSVEVKNGETVIRTESHEIAADGLERRVVVSEGSTTTTTVVLRESEESLRTIVARETVQYEGSEEVVRGYVTETLEMSDGSVTEIERFLKDGELTSELLTMKDAEGNVTYTRQVQHDTNAIYGDVVQVDEEYPDGRTASETMGTKDGELVYHEIYEKEASGAWTRRTLEYHGNGESTETLIRHDAHDQLVERTTTLVRFDEDGNRKTFTETVAGATKTTQEEVRSVPDDKLIAFERSVRVNDQLQRHEAITVLNDGTERSETKTYKADNSLDHSLAIETKVHADGTRTVTRTSVESDGTGIQETLFQDENGNTLSRIQFLTSTYLDENGNTVNERQYHSPDGGVQLEHAFYTPDGELIETRSYSYSKDENGVEVRRWVTNRPDGWSREIAETTSPDGLTVREETLIEADGLVTRFYKKTQNGTRLEEKEFRTYLDNEGRLVEDTLEYLSDGTRRTLATTDENGHPVTVVTRTEGSTQTITTTSVLANGVERVHVQRKPTYGPIVEEYVIETALDGSKIVRERLDLDIGGQVRERIIRQRPDGTEMERWEVVTLDSGRVIETRWLDDPSGVRITVITDTDASGHAVTTRLTPLAEGGRLREVTETQPDGSVQTIVYREQEAGNGNFQVIDHHTIVTRKTQSPPKTTVTTTYADGRTYEVETFWVSRDKPEEGLTTVTETWTENGLQVKRQVATYHALGQVDEVREVRDASNNLVSFFKSMAFDSGQLYTEMNEWLADGSYREERIDRQADGTLNAHTYKEIKPNGDGTLTIITFEQYASVGSETKTYRVDEAHVDDPSEWELIDHDIVTPTYVRDEDGNVVTEIYYKDETQQEILLTVVTTTDENGWSTTEYYSPSPLAQEKPERVEVRDGDNVLRELRFTELRGDGARSLVTRNYRENGTLEMELIERFDASEALTFRRESTVAEDGSRVEKWQEYSSATMTLSGVTHKDADGMVIANEETEVRLLDGGIRLETIRKTTDSGDRVTTTTRRNAEGELLYSESETRRADGSEEYTRFQVLSDGTTVTYQFTLDKDRKAKETTTTEDPSGKRTVAVREVRDADDFTETITVWDANGKKVSETEHEVGPTDYRDRVWTWDENGRSMTEYTRSSDPVGSSQRELLWNSEGVLVSENAIYSYEGNQQIIEKRYDDQGNLTWKRESIHLARQGRISTTIEERLDDGNWRIHETVDAINFQSESWTTKDPEGNVLSHKSWDLTTTYDIQTKRYFLTYNERREDGTRQTREAIRTYMDHLIEVTEWEYDAQNDLVTRTRYYDMGPRTMPNGYDGAEAWTQTVTYYENYQEVKEVTTRTVLYADGSKRLDTTTTWPDGVEVTDFRIVDAEGQVLEYKTSTKRPKEGGGFTVDSEARTRDGRFIEEFADHAVDGSREVTTTTTWPNGDTQEIVARDSAKNELLSKTETFVNHETGVTTIHEVVNSRYTDPSAGSSTEKLQEFDAEGNLLREDWREIFVNNTRYESSYVRENDGSERTETREIDSDGRLLYGYEEIRSADGFRTVITKKTHIDGSTERIEARVNASNQILDFKHVWIDVLGKEHAVSDTPKVPTAKAALVQVINHETTTVTNEYGSRQLRDRVEYVYADGKRVYEDLLYHQTSQSRLAVSLTKQTSNGVVLYEQRWTDYSGYIDLYWAPEPRGPRIEYAADGFQTLEVQYTRYGEVIVWQLNPLDSYVIRRDIVNKWVHYSGTFERYSSDRYHFHFVSPDGNWEFSGVSSTPFTRINPVANWEVWESTEVILNPGAGTKRIIQRENSYLVEGNSQVIDITYGKHPETGEYVPRSLTISNSYPDKSKTLVERSFDAKGNIQFERHTYEYLTRPDSNGVMYPYYKAVTTISYDSDGSNVRTTEFYQNRNLVKKEIVETTRPKNSSPLDVAGETVVTKIYDRYNNLTHHTVATAITNRSVLITTFQGSLPAKVEMASVETRALQDGRIERVYTLGNTVTTWTWGPSGEFMGTSKTVTSDALITTENTTPDGRRTITMMERENGQITAITTSDVNPFGHVRNVSRTPMPSMSDPLSKVAADGILKAIGFSFVTQPDGSQRIDFSKTINGQPLTLENLDLTKVGIDINQNAVTQMTNAFMDIVRGNGSEAAFGKLIGSLIHASKTANGSPQLFATYVAFTGIDLALMESPYAQQWVKIKSEINSYLTTGIQGGVFGPVDMSFKFIDSLTDGAVTKWFHDNGLGNALEVLQNPYAVIGGTPGEYLTNVMRSVITGGAYLPARFIYNMLPDSVQEFIDNALESIPGYTSIAKGLRITSGYIDYGVRTALNYAREYTQKAFEWLLDPESYVKVYHGIVSVGDAVASFATGIYDSLSTTFLKGIYRVSDVTAKFGNLIRDIAIQGVEFAERIANEVYGGLKTVANAIWDGANWVADQVVDGFKKFGSLLGF